MSIECQLGSSWSDLFATAENDRFPPFESGDAPGRIDRSVLRGVIRRCRAEPGFFANRPLKASLRSFVLPHTATIHPACSEVVYVVMGD